MTGIGMAINGTYDYRLVALSVLIAVLASYAALDLAARVTAAQGRIQFAWLLGGAAAMGTGIWSMHYIGMLAFSPAITAACCFYLRHCALRRKPPENGIAGSNGGQCHYGRRDRNHALH